MRKVLETEIEIFWPNDIVTKDITIESMWNWIYSLFFEWIPNFPYQIFLDVEKIWKRKITLRVEIDLSDEDLEKLWLNRLTNLHIWDIVWIDLPNFKPFLGIKQRDFIESILEDILWESGFDDWVVDGTKVLVDEVIL